MPEPEENLKQKFDAALKRIEALEQTVSDLVKRLASGAENCDLAKKLARMWDVKH